VATRARLACVSVQQSSHVRVSQVKSARLEKDLLVAERAAGQLMQVEQHLRRDGRRWEEVGGGGRRWKEEVGGGGRRWAEVEGDGRRWEEARNETAGLVL
jgi:hypothetical protein